MEKRRCVKGIGKGFELRAEIWNSGTDRIDIKWIQNKKTNR
jgi:hypothetical protein